MTNSNDVYCVNILHYSHSFRYYVVPRFASEHTVTDVVNSSFDNLYLSHLLICDANVDCRARQFDIQSRSRALSPFSAPSSRERYFGQLVTISRATKLFSLAPVRPSRRARRRRRWVSGDSTCWYDCALGASVKHAHVAPDCVCMHAPGPPTSCVQSSCCASEQAL